MSRIKKLVKIILIPVDFLSSKLISTKKVKKFCVFGFASGTTYLVDLLDSDSVITCHGEIFHPTKICYSKKLDHGKFDKFTNSFKKAFPVFFTEHVWNLKNTNARFVGLKFLFGQEKRVKEYVMKNRHVSKILVHRQNLLKRYVSHKIAYKTNVWNSRQGHIQESVEIDVDDYLSDVKKNKQVLDDFRNMIKKTDQKYVEVIYEDLVNNKNSELDKVLDYLGVKGNPVLLKSRLQKQKP